MIELIFFRFDRFVFRASEIPNPHDTTACLYSNEAWISTLPEFVKVWKGPISLVFETSHSRHSPLRTTLIFTIESLRLSDPLIRKHVDFHFVGVPNATSEKSLNRLREKLILRPVAQNFHFNLARFFAKTEIIFMVGDARILPSPGLFDKLQKQDMKELILERGDALVVPTFGFVRDRTGGVATLPNLAVTRKAIGLRPVIERAGVSEREFEVLAKGNVDAHFDSLPIPTSRWPTKKSTIVSLVSTKPGTLVIPSSATLALFDESWDLNRGPTNWYLWRKSISDPRLADSPSVGGGLGLGLNETIGGGANVYKIIDYDLHYSPALVMSNKGQPWCTERFETLKSACVYQIYLTGTELWVLPEEWIFTLEPIEKIDDKVVEDPGLALKVSFQFSNFQEEN